MRLLFAIVLISASAVAEIENRKLEIENPITPPQKWQNPVVWRAVKPGISPNRVRQILGDPADTESTSTRQIWYYADIPTTDDKGHIQRPSHGFVMFRNSPSGMMLDRIVEPSWQTMPTWQQLQTDYQKALADQRAAEIEANRQQAAEAAAQRMAERQKQTKTQQQVPINRKLKIENHQSTVPAAKPDEQTQRASRYFIGCGIAFGIIALIIAGSRGFKLFNS